MLSEEEVQGLLRALGSEVHPCPEAVRNHLMELIRGGCPGDPEQTLDGEESGE